MIKTFFQWRRSWAELDLSLLIESISLNKFSGIGTGRREYYHGRETSIQNFRDQFEKYKNTGLVPRQFDESDFEIKDSYVSGSNGFLVVHDDKMPMRFTCIFELQNDKWRIIHIHISTPDPTFLEGELFRSQKAMQQTLENWISSFDFDPEITDELKKSKLKEYLIHARDLIEETIK